jgi:hypothetical protein
MQQEKARVFWRTLLWVFWALILAVALLGLIAQLGENLERLLKAWRPFFVLITGPTKRD